MGKTKIKKNIKATGELDKKIQKNRRASLRLFILLLVELFVLLLINPGYLGVPWLETILKALAAGCSNVLWPVFPRDEGTYKETIYIVCTWVTNLWFFPLIRFLAVWLLPAWLAGSLTRGYFLQHPLSRDAKPAKERKETRFGKVRCVLDRTKCLQANEYLQEQLARNSSFFPPVSGIRIRRPNAVNQVERDVVIPWGQDDTILLEGLGSLPPMKIIRKNGTACLYTHEEDYEMCLNQPIILQHENTHGKVIQDAAIIWIGG